MDLAVPSPSVGLLTNTVAGYYEISYWQSAYFNTVANAANVAYFSTTKFWVSTTIQTVNYDNLFLTYDLNLGVGSDPLVNSLFNIDTFQALILAG